MDYYLCGLINGSDYACDSDYANLGVYKFINGQLVVTFEQDSYVGVKTADNETWYMTNGWLGYDVTSAILYDTVNLTSGDKLFVPGGVEITFTLLTNDDGTLTLSYTQKDAVEKPTISPKFPALSFVDEIVLDVFFTISDTTNVSEIGLITYSTAVGDWSVNNAEYVVPGYVYSADHGMNYVSTQGIPAQNLGDIMYFSVYAELTDGSYVYSKLVHYSPATYAYNLLNNPTTDNDMKALVVAMLNYGAEAQKYFGYKTDNLVNNNLTAAQRNLVNNYYSGMVSAIGRADSSKAGIFQNTGGFSKKYPLVTFEGAFCIDYYFTPSNVPSGSVKLYYWTQEDYDRATTLSPSNASGYVYMTGETEYWGAVSGIAAKDLDSTIYVAAGYSSNGASYCTGILPYSIGSYCVTHAAGTSAIQPFAAATAVYGYYAEVYFSKN